MYYSKAKIIIDYCCLSPEIHPIFQLSDEFNLLFQMVSAKVFLFTLNINSNLMKWKYAKTYHTDSEYHNGLVDNHNNLVQDHIWHCHNIRNPVYSSVHICHQDKAAHKLHRCIPMNIYNNRLSCYFWKKKLPSKISKQYSEDKKGMLSILYMDAIWN